MHRSLRLNQEKAPVPVALVSKDRVQVLKAAPVVFGGQSQVLHGREPVIKVLGILNRTDVVSQKQEESLLRERGRRGGLREAESEAILDECRIEVTLKSIVVRLAESLEADIQVKECIPDPRVIRLRDWVVNGGRHLVVRGHEARHEGRGAVDLQVHPEVDSLEAVVRVSLAETLGDQAPGGEVPIGPGRGARTGRPVVDFAGLVRAARSLRLAVPDLVECHHGECHHGECHHGECHHGECHHGIQLVEVQAEAVGSREWKASENQVALKAEVPERRVV